MFMYSLILSDAYIMAISSCRGGCPSPSSKYGPVLHSFIYSKICTHGSSEKPEKDFGSFCDIQFDSYTGSLITNHESKVHILKNEGITFNKKTGKILIS